MYGLDICGQKMNYGDYESLLKVVFHFQLKFKKGKSLP